MTNPVKEGADKAVACRWWASVLFSEIDEKQLDLYGKGELGPLLEGLPHLIPEEDADLVEALRQDIESWKKVTSARLILATDYASLFLGHGREGPLPYASYYYSEGRRLFAKPHDDMVERLNKAGLQINAQGQEPADHLAIMVSYLALLYEESHSAAYIATFITEGILSWLPQFTKHCNNVTTEFQFYQLVLQILQAFLQKEAEEIRGA
ncbi:molecular chaperone TorD [Rhodobacteraceae bacterium RKSG542]|uniref:molecular chaperone TorD n=1 Tax=Pseudovibrio flavus TaxID=2529854 RepID=UPI0012BC3F05|nr:molecular chaperone TorD [Pseudovibrio flavus]MTI16238.1 molecular chaperone TorD [Pseudovibrio flavus]